MSDLLELVKKAALKVDVENSGKGGGDKSQSWLRFGRYNLMFKRFEYITNNEPHASIREGLRAVFDVVTHDPFQGYSATEEIRAVVEETAHEPATEVVRTYNIAKASVAKFGLEPLIKEMSALFSALWQAGPVTEDETAFKWFDAQAEANKLDPDADFNHDVQQWFFTQTKKDQESLSAAFEGTVIGLDLVPGRNKEGQIKTFTVKSTGATAVDKRHFWLVRS